MSEVNSSFGIGLDVKKSTFDQFYGEMNKVNSTIDRAEANIKRFEKSGESALANYRKSIQKLYRDIEKLNMKIAASGNPKAWSAQAAKIKILKNAIASLSVEYRQLASHSASGFETSNITAYSRAIKRLKTDIAAMQTQMKLSGSQDVWSQLTPKLKTQKAALDALTNAMNRYSAAAQESAAKSAMATAGKKGGIADFSDVEIKAAVKALDDYEKSTKKVAKAAKGTTDAIRAGSDAFWDDCMTIQNGKAKLVEASKLSSNAKNSKTSISELAQSNWIASDATWALEDAQGKLGDTLGKTSKAFDKGGKKADFFNSRMAKFGVTMSGIAATIFVVQQVVQWISTAIEVTKEFQSTMLNLSSSLGVSQQQSAAAINQLYSGSSNIDNVSESLNALHEAGYHGAKGIELLPKVMKYARHEMISFKDAVSIATNDVYGLKDALDQYNAEYEETLAAKQQTVKNFFSRTIKNMGTVANEIASNKVINSFLENATLPILPGGMQLPVGMLNNVIENHTYQKEKNALPIISPTAKRAAYATLSEFSGKIPQLYQLDLVGQLEDSMTALRSNLTGDKFAQKLIDQMEESQMKALELDKKIADNRILSAGATYRAAATFGTTGFMSETYYKDLEMERKARFENAQKIADTSKYVTGRDVFSIPNIADGTFTSVPRSAAVENINTQLENYKSFNQSRITFEEEYGNQFNVVTQEYVDKNIEILKMEHDKRVMMGMDSVKSFELMQAQISDVQRMADPDKWTAGFKQAAIDYAIEFGNSFELVKAYSSSAFSTIEDHLVNFIKTFKFDFESFTDQIASMWLKMVIKMTLAKAMEGTESGSGFFSGAWKGFSSAFSFISALTGNGTTPTGHATGGIAAANTDYIVGERGPEVLRMGSMPGFVVPNNASNGSPNIVINNYSKTQISQKEERGQNGELKSIVLSIIDREMKYNTGFRNRQRKMIR